MPAREQKKKLIDVANLLCKKPIWHEKNVGPDEGVHHASVNTATSQHRKPN